MLVYTWSLDSGKLLRSMAYPNCIFNTNIGCQLQECVFLLSVTQVLHTVNITVWLSLQVTFFLITAFAFSSVFSYIEWSIMWLPFLLCNVHTFLFFKAKAWTGAIFKAKFCGSKSYIKYSVFIKNLTLQNLKVWENGFR